MRPLAVEIFKTEIFKTVYVNQYAARYNKTTAQASLIVPVAKRCVSFRMFRIMGADFVKIPFEFGKAI